MLLITNAPLSSFCNNYKNNDKETNESLTINTPSLLKDEIVWLFLLRHMCEMFRHFVSTLFYYNNKSRVLRASQVADPFHHPLLSLSFSLFRKHLPIWTTLELVIVRFVPIEKGRIFWMNKNSTFKITNCHYHNHIRLFSSQVKKCSTWNLPVQNDTQYPATSV